MAIFMVLLPPGTPRAAPRERDLERAVFIKDGFSFPAFFLSIPWLLWQRLWLVLCGFLVLTIALELAARYSNGPGAGIISLLVTFLFAPGGKQPSSLDAGAARLALCRRGGGPPSPGRRTAFLCRPCTGNGRHAAPGHGRGTKRGRSARHGNACGQRTGDSRPAHKPRAGRRPDTGPPSTLTRPHPLTSRAAPCFRPALS